MVVVERKEVHIGGLENEKKEEKRVRVLCDCIFYLNIQ